MAFVTCTQFKNSQEEQDEKIENLEACCKENTEKNQEQDQAIEKLQNQAISAEDDLLDKSSDKEGSGKITVEKIKEAIAGDVEVAVAKDSIITGNGTKEQPLNIDADKAAVLVSGKTTIRLLDAFGQEDEVAYAFETQGGK